MQSSSSAAAPSALQPGWTLASSMDAIFKNKQDSTLHQIYIYFYPIAHISSDKNHA